ncbi:MAG: hypothetical protein HY290_22630 [Planctomycetia bacterium]|nr:hypothetical protein [Planctomycetia bacterium]
MRLHRLKKLALLTIAGFGCCLAATQSISASGHIVAVDPACDECCEPTCCQKFCRTLKLHCVYFKRSCCQKYILVPTTQGCPPYGYTAPACPPQSSPFPYPTINGYGTPRINTAPTGVFIR